MVQIQNYTQSELHNFTGIITTSVIFDNELIFMIKMRLREKGALK